MSMKDPELCEQQMYANRGLLTGTISLKVRAKICGGFQGLNVQEKLQKVPLRKIERHEKPSVQ